MKPIDTFGDVNPIDYGGGVIFEEPAVGYQIEYVYGGDAEPDEFDIADTEIRTFTEGDDEGLVLLVKTFDGTGEELAGWDDIHEAVSDGDLDYDNLHQSAFETAEEQMLLDPIQQLPVFTVDVPDDVFDWHNWVDLKEVAESQSMTVRELRELGRSPKVMGRVAALEAIAAYHGWSALDDSPHKEPACEVAERWGVDL